PLRRFRVSAAVGRISNPSCSKRTDWKSVLPGRGRSAGPIALAAKEVAQPFQEALALRLHMLGIDLGQLAQQLLLALRQIPRRLDHQADVQVARLVMVDVIDALAAEAQHRAGLRARRDVVRERTVERGDVDLPAQGRLAEGDRHLADQVRSLALKERMFLDAK